MQDYTRWYCGALLLQQILMVPAEDHNTALVHSNDWFPPVYLSFTKSSPRVVFTSIAMWKSQATSTAVFKFPGVLGRCHRQTNVFGTVNRQHRDHSCSSDKKEAKNKEPGEFTVLLTA